jgi:hypothetical protein
MVGASLQQMLALERIVCALFVKTVARKTQIVASKTQYLCRNSPYAFRDAIAIQPILNPCRLQPPPWRTFGRTMGVLR